MRPERLEDLRLQGHAPRSLLDIGAHLGHFTQGFLAAFPDCAPTLIEPNLHCQAALAALGHELHAVAASAEPGEADLFLTREWLQSTGCSLYRENTHFFRDEVLDRAPVPKRRIDDLFAGRRFDFVKIDTQGAELDVLAGGREVLREARHILIEVSLVEYNQGGARAEDVFAALAGLGFRSAEACEFHRLRGVQGGGLLQMDFLFEREVMRPSQTLRPATPTDHAALPRWLRERQSRCRDFSILHLGPPIHGWHEAAPSLHVEAEPTPAAMRRLTRHVAHHGRFSHAICTEDVLGMANPPSFLEILPRIAEAGLLILPPGAARWMMEMHGPHVLLSPSVPGHAPPEMHLHWRGAIALKQRMPLAGRRNFLPGVHDL